MVKQENNTKGWDLSQTELARAWIFAGSSHTSVLPGAAVKIAAQKRLINHLVDLPISDLANEVVQIAKELETLE